MENIYNLTVVIFQNESEPDTWDDWGSPEIVIADKELIKEEIIIKGFFLFSKVR